MDSNDGGSDDLKTITSLCRTLSIVAKHPQIKKIVHSEPPKNPLRISRDCFEDIFNEEKNVEESCRDSIDSFIEDFDIIHSENKLPNCCTKILDLQEKLSSPKKFFRKKRGKSNELVKKKSLLQKWNTSWSVLKNKKRVRFKGNKMKNLDEKKVTKSEDSLSRKSIEKINSRTKSVPYCDYSDNNNRFSTSIDIICKKDSRLSTRGFSSSVTPMRFDMSKKKFRKHQMKDMKFMDNLSSFLRKMKK